jgi:maleate isomerase
LIRDFMSMRRIGLLVPSSNTTMEPDFYAMAPEGVTIHSARMPLDRVTPESLEAMSAYASSAGGLLAAADVGVLVYGCTSGSLLRGVKWEAGLVSKLEEETGIPTLSTAGAVVGGLDALGVSRLGVATPYTDEINRLEQRFLEAHGFEVVSIMGLGLVDNRKIATVTPEEVWRLVRMVAGGSDSVFVSCTNLPVVSLVQRMESELGVPIVTSNQASMWASLKLLGFGGTSGYGSLLEGLEKRHS